MMDEACPWTDSALHKEDAMRIDILGTGCPKCKKTMANAEEAVRELGISAEIVKVEKISDIMNYGVMATPALAIDGEVKVAGRIPKVEEIEGWLRAEL
jgi:small redox-active disulfide protein 2